MNDEDISNMALIANLQANALCVLYRALKDPVWGMEHVKLVSECKESVFHRAAEIARIQEAVQ